MIDDETELKYENIDIPEAGSSFDENTVCNPQRGTGTVVTDQ